MIINLIKKGQYSWRPQGRVVLTVWVRFWERVLFLPSGPEVSSGVPLFTVDTIEDSFDLQCQAAAQHILSADVLLVSMNIPLYLLNYSAAGAGFSADSGLSTYAEFSSIDTYKNRGY